MTPSAGSSGDTAAEAGAGGGVAPGAPATGAAPPDEQRGLVAGRFRIGELLGSGGTASVFAAVDVVTGRRLALKLLHPHLSESAPLREAFLEEARRAAQVSHPRIVVIVDIGVFLEGGIPIAWIAQERVEGVTLGELVRAHGALSPRDAVSLGADVLAGLEAAHAAGLIHRDVSPSNVLVRRDDDGILHATLLDFGLADAAGRTARGDDVLRSAVTADTAGVVGNAQFASPEQLSGNPVDARGDLYQVGGLLFFALTGRPPFDGGDRLAVVRAHLNAPPPVPSVQRPGVPPAVDRVVVRALLKDPDDRFTDAGEMRTALLAAVVAPAVAAPATRVLRSVASAAVTSSLRTAPSSAAGARPAPVRERRGTAWGVVVGIIAVLVGAATAVPLMAGAGRTVPLAEAATPSPVSTPTAAAVDPVPTTPAPETTTASPTTVPALGQLSEATALLATAELRLGDVVERDSPFAAGTVLESSPAAGASAPRGSTVRLVVASGSTTVPDLVGMDAATAGSHLRAAGLTMLSVPVVSERPVGTVAGADPAAGSSVPLGGEVRVLVSTAPTPAPTPTATPTPAPVVTPTPTPTASAH